jgi:hypothetical protein
MLMTLLGVCDMLSRCKLALSALCEMENGLKF